MTSNKFENLL